MSVTRAWFQYVGGPGGSQNSINYIHVDDFPPDCVDGSPNICAAYGIYIPATYGVHPKPFGPKLSSYISLAVGNSSQQPSGLAKRYVYVHS